MFKKIKNRKGFTLIELIVVIAILAVLAAIIIPTVSSSIERAQNARDLANSRSIYAALSIEILSDADFADVVDATRGTSEVTCTYSVTAQQVTSFVCVGQNETYSLNTGTGEIE